MSRLTIGRKENQSFYIYVDDKEIEVFVKKARGGQTVFSIDADEDVVIKREELVEIPIELSEEDEDTLEDIGKDIARSISSGETEIGFSKLNIIDDDDYFISEEEKQRGSLVPKPIFGGVMRGTKDNSGL